jgi:hypothetical protein
MNTDVRQPRWTLWMLLPSNGYARCYRCRRPYWAVKDFHDVWYEAARGQFALCEHCWGRSTPEQRWQAHEWACSLSTSGWADREIEALRRAILQEAE